MANSVNSVIEFHQINDEAKAKLNELMERCREMDYGRRWFGDLFVGEEVNEENEELTYEECEQYGWTTSFLGTKWCFIEEFDEESMLMITDSAWSAPEYGVENLLEILAEYDPNMITSIRYQDEAMNFIGWQVWEGSDSVDGSEEQQEDIQVAFFNIHPELAEHYDEEEYDWKTDENGDYTEEAEAALDEYQALIYDVANDILDEGIEDALRIIKESREAE